MDCCAHEMSYILLKPDGNRPEVKRYVLESLHSVGAQNISSRALKFTVEQAFAFYPKDNEWKKKYGCARVNMWIQRRCENGRCLDPVVVGEQILMQMAEYLSSGECTLIRFVLEERDALKWARVLVGSTIPANADPFSLRGAFGRGEQLEDAVDRALHNVAHAPENSQEMARELSIIESMTRIEFA